MTISIGLALAALVLGLVLYFLPVRADVKELGRILFFVGAFWLVAPGGALLVAASHAAPAYR